MTLAEKVGQLVQQSPFANVDWKVVEEKKKQALDKGLPFFLHEALPPEVEAIVTEGRTGTVMCTDVTLVNHLQRLAVEKSRLHIPLLIAADVIHGLHTIFPIPLAQACSWNLALIERVEAAAAAEASASGVNWIFAPMVDITRDPRWGRIAEGAGEDPWLDCRLPGRACGVFKAANPSRVIGWRPAPSIMSGTVQPRPGATTTRRIFPNAPCVKFTFRLSILHWMRAPVP